MSPRDKLFAVACTSTCVGVVVTVHDVCENTSAAGPVTNTRTWYLHTDQQGSTTLTSSGNGQLAAQYYDPFGQRTGRTGKPLGNGRRDGPRQGYTGHEHDDEYGLINMKGRIYDPAARRFLTPDPIQPPVSSQALNRYSYVQNNPATLTDPTGYVWNPPQDGGPFGGGTGPFNPGPGGTGMPCGTGPWSGICLGGTLNETPTPTDADIANSSDDDNASAADDGSVPAGDPEPCSSRCTVLPEITIETPLPVEDGGTAGDGGTTATSDEDIDLLDIVDTLGDIVGSSETNKYLIGFGAFTDIKGWLELANGETVFDAKGAGGTTLFALKTLSDLAQGWTAWNTLARWGLTSMSWPAAAEATAAAAAFPWIARFGNIGAAVSTTYLSARLGLTLREWSDPYASAGGPNLRTVISGINLVSGAEVPVLQHVLGGHLHERPLSGYQAQDW